MKLSLTVGKAVNIGNYEAIRVDVGLETTVLDKVDLVDEIRDLYYEIDNIIDDLIRKEKATKR